MKNQLNFTVFRYMINIIETLSKMILSAWLSLKYFTSNPYSFYQIIFRLLSWKYISNQLLLPIPRFVWIFSCLLFLNGPLLQFDLWIRVDEIILPCNLLSFNECFFFSLLANTPLVLFSSPFNYIWKLSGALQNLYFSIVIVFISILVAVHSRFICPLSNWM